METFERNEKGSMMAEGVSVSSLALQYGTPLYIYSEKALRDHFSEFDKSAGDFPHLICCQVLDRVLGVDNEYQCVNG